MQKILVTGSAGFIGFHLVNKLAGLGYEVVGIDNINEFYDVRLKYDRLKEAGIDIENIKEVFPVASNKFNYRFYKFSIEKQDLLFEIFRKEKPDYVVHLAAQAGVRYSLENPFAYVNSNLIAFVNMLEAVKREGNVKHFVYASSSSVYGLNNKYPLSVKDNVDHPVSLYAATKKSNELLAHSYSYLYDIPSTGLRFFTVYGPWGRPDMALFIFTKSILERKPLQVFNNGRMERDFTYIDDIVNGVVKVLFKPPVPKKSIDEIDPSNSVAPFKVLNIGNSKPVNLLEFIEIIEKELGKKVVKEFKPLQPGDVVKTYADVTELIDEYGYKPDTPLKTGVKNFVSWYLDYYKIK